MCQTFFGADRHHGFGIGVQFDIEAAFIPVTDGQAQLVDAARGRVAVIRRLARSFDQFLHHMRWRGMVWIAHAEVDDVFPGPPRLQFEFIERGKEIGGKPFNPWEFHKRPVKPFCSSYLSPIPGRSRPFIRV